MSNVDGVVNARLFFADGRIVEDQIFPLAPPESPYAILDNRRVHWFLNTRHVDGDGFLELRETGNASP
jgi:hypothetical protein